MADRVLTTDEAARVAHVRPSLILKWASRGYLPVKKVRRGTRMVNGYRESDVLRCEKRRRDNGRQATLRLRLTPEASEYIKGIVDNAPPLTAEQVQLLRVILNTPPARVRHD